MTRVLVLSGHDLGQWRRNFKTGSAPAALPYGVEALEQHGFRIEASGKPRPVPWLRKFRDVAEHRTGLSLQVPLAAAPRAARADIVLALLEQEGALPSLMKQRHVPPYTRKPLIVWSCWLADDVQRADHSERQRLKQMYAGVDLLTHMSRHEQSILTDLGIPEDRLHAITFGVSHRYYTPGHESERDLDVVAVGMDRGRDYATLFSAIEGQRLTLDLVCKPDNVDHLRIPNNVRVHGTIPHDQYRSLLRRAKIVAVPTRVLAYPTGQSVALEAASTGCCVVATETPAMSDYIADGSTGTLVPPGDVSGWRNALFRLLEDDALRRRLGDGARRSVVERFNADNMWAELAEQLNRRGLT